MSDKYPLWLDDEIKWLKYMWRHKWRHEEYYLKNQEELVKRQRQYYQNNRKEIIQRAHNKHLNHPEIRREYYINNRLEILAKRKRTLIENPHTIRQQKKNYRQRHKTDPIEILKNKTRIKSYQKISIEGVKCFNCKLEQATERHHPDYTKPLDVLLLCHECHRQIHHPLITKSKGGKNGD